MNNMFSEDSRYINKILKSNNVIFNEISDLFIVLMNDYADENVELFSDKVCYTANSMILKMSEFLKSTNTEITTIKQIKKKQKKNIHYHDVLLTDIINEASIKIASNVQKGLSKIAEQDSSQNDGKIKRFTSCIVKLFKAVFTELKMILMNKSMKKNVKNEHLSFWKNSLDDVQDYLFDTSKVNDEYIYYLRLFPDFVRSLHEFVDQFVSEIETKAVLNINKLTEENFIENIPEVKPKSILITLDSQKGKNKRVSFVDVIESKHIDNLDKKESVSLETIDFSSSMYDVDLGHETSEDLSLNNGLKRQTTKENEFKPSDLLNDAIILNLEQKIQKQR